MNTSNATQANQSEFANFGPVIDAATMAHMEKAAAGNEVGTSRRLALLACARSMETLAAISAEQPEAFADILDSVESFKEHAQGLLEVAETALLRLQLADCRNEPALQ
ncbi:hypothetical protein [Gulbenkiania mobilis]|uniref:Uncharacterized protein n=1 Tax=Gulbenkiania mobilis TaxID=397457 RepID=A0ABY2CTM7_GULMO|nr:hypothetical protein EV669_11139 [Gulbenkiania mobilis]